MIRSSLLLAAIIAGTTFLTPTQAVAQCACWPYFTLREEFQRADVVFIGRVVEAKTILEKKSQVTLVKVEVLQTWKRDLERFVTVKYRHEEGFTAHFEPNFKSLLYAHKDKDGTFFAWTCCLPTKPLTQADDDLKLFEKWGEKTKKIIEPEPPHTRASQKP